MENKQYAVRVRFKDGTMAYFNCEQEVFVGDIVIADGREGGVVEKLEWLDIQDFPIVERILDECIIDYDGIESDTVKKVNEYTEAPIIEEKIVKGEYIETAADYEIENGVLKRYNGADKFIRIPNGVTEIGSNSFHAKFIKGVIISASVKIIGKQAFYCQSNLTEVIFEGVPEEICEEAFSGCRRLFCIELPRGVVKIGDSAFAQHTMVLVPEEKDQPQWNSRWVGYHARDRVVYGYNTSRFVKHGCLLYEGTSVDDIHMELDKADELAVVGMLYPQENIVIPSTVMGKSVVVIEDMAFKSLIGIREVYIPDTVELIGEEAFCYSELERVRLPECECLIESYAFACKYIKYLHIPQGVRFEDDTSNQFGDIKELEAVVIDEGCDWIPPWAFCGCDKLGAIILPESIVEIADCAFLNCNHLVYVILKSVPEIAENAFPKIMDIQANKKDGKLYMGCKQNPFAVQLQSERK